MTNSRPPNADNEPNDLFGYSAYVVVIPAPDWLAEAQQEIWRRYPTDRASIPAHITVKGTFVQISCDLDEVRGLVREVAGATAPFEVSFDGLEIHWGHGMGIAWLKVFPEIQGLHDRLVAAISPVSELRYPDDPYAAHMSLTSVHRPEPPEAAVAEWEAFEFGEGFTADRVRLIGRVGQAWDGEWRLIEEFALGAGG